MSRQKKRVESTTVVPMEKPKWVQGDMVVLEFLGSKKTGYIQGLAKNPQHTERWIYSIKDSVDGTIYPWVGVDKSEKYSNIITDATNALHNLITT